MGVRMLLVRNFLVLCAFVGLVAACGQKNQASESSTLASTRNSNTVIGLKPKNAASLTLNQLSTRGLSKGITCNYKLQPESEMVEIVPSTRERVLSANGLEYFVQLRKPIDAAACSGTDAVGKFDYKFFFVLVSDADLVGSQSVAPEPAPQPPVSTDDLRSRRAEALASDMERRRSGGGKACGLTSFGQRGCWACVGWAMTDTGIFPRGLGSDADATPNGFLRATASARARKSGDGIVNINGVRFRSLKAEYGTTPSLAPRGSILFCNTSAAGHVAVITKPANEMRSDVIEILGATYRQSLCWDQVQEILFPLD